MACYLGHCSVAQLLIDRGADVNTVDAFGMTPLQRACEKGWLEVVTLMLEANK